jgi:predicted ester cyclase
MGRFALFARYDPRRQIRNVRHASPIQRIRARAPKGADAARDFMKMYVTSFADLHFHVDQTIASGEFVVTRYTAPGTQRGPLMSIPATNRAATIHGCAIGQVQNGKVVHNWLYWDSGSLLSQLGIMPRSK